MHSEVLRCQKLSMKSNATILVSFGNMARTFSSVILSDSLAKRDGILSWGLERDVKNVPIAFTIRTIPYTLKVHSEVRFLSTVSFPLSITFY